MANQEPMNQLEAKEYVIPRYAVDHLLESFKIVRTELSELLDIPDTNRAEWSEYAEKWWNSQTEEDQSVLRKIITAMGSPVLVTNLTVMHGNEGLVSTRAVFTSTRLEDPAFMIGVDDEGNGFDPDSVPDPTTDSNILRESGRGVFLMRSYADECRFENGGRRVVLVKRHDLPHDGPLDTG